MTVTIMTIAGGPGIVLPPAPPCWQWIIESLPDVRVAGRNTI